MVELYVVLKRRSNHDEHVLRLRYEEDWQVAGRREDFVDPENYATSDESFWPSGISGINPGNNRSAICLRGLWGFHSVLHSGEGRPTDRTLIQVLRNLQTLFNRS